ncbi:gliding motility-associated C-terminal domain-containing protein [Bacteriovoracaceae bacterium]|nr:gliding motility-associated C-terminal domain-containing protein [Bacteriovoracaceae bacterium]
MYYHVAALVFSCGLLCSSISFAQKWNLVKNGGFEERIGISCPTAYETLDRSFVANWQGTDSEILVKDCPQWGWDANIGSTPYTSTNFCELSNTTVPENNVYAGFFVKSGSRSENVGGDLRTSLLPNVTYQVTVDVALSKSYPNQSGDQPYKGVMKNFEWQFVSEPYNVHGASLYIPGHGNIPTGPVNDTWTNTYTIPRSTTPNDWFTFDYFQLKETPANPETPYLNVSIADHPNGTTGTVHDAIGMPSNNNPNLMYYKWFTISRELAPGNFPTDKEHFVFGMFYNPSGGNYTVNNAASSPVCTSDNFSAFCDTGGAPFCPSAGATPQCPNGGQVACQMTGPPTGNPDEDDPFLNFPICPHSNGNAYYFMDNVSLTCDPKIEMDIQIQNQGTGQPIAGFQNWKEALEHTSTHVEQIYCGTNINLRGTQENIAAQDGHRWSVYSHLPGEPSSGDNTNKCTPNYTERRIYQTDNSPWVGNGPFSMETLLEYKYRNGPEYWSSNLFDSSQNFITLRDNEQVTIINEGSCHRIAESTDPEANSPFLGKHYTLEVIPPVLDIQVQETVPPTNPAPNPEMILGLGLDKSDPIEMMCGDDLQIHGTVTNMNNNLVQWFFKTDLPDGQILAGSETFSANDNIKRISEIIGNNEIPRSENGDADVEVGLAGSCNSGPIRTVRAGGDKRFFRLKMEPPTITGGGEINCADLDNSETGLVTGLSSINPTLRDMNWKVSIIQNSTLNPQPQVGITNQNFNLSDPNGLQEVTIQTLLESTDLNNVSLVDGDIIEIGFGDQCTGPIKSDFQYKKVQFTIVGDPLEMDVFKEVGVCDGAVDVDENTVDVLTPPLFRVMGEGLTDKVDWVIYDVNDEGVPPVEISRKLHGQFNTYLIDPKYDSMRDGSGRNFASIRVNMQKLFEDFSINFNIQDRNKVLIKGFARDSGNCGSSAGREVKVAHIAAGVPIFHPNVFTPNGDGINEKPLLGVGSPETNNGPSETFHVGKGKYKVFDRWGELVYAQDVPNLSFNSEFTLDWDGTFKGQPLNPAVFVWFYEYSSEVCPSILMKGDITLIR